MARIEDFEFLKLLHNCEVKLAVKKEIFGWKAQDVFLCPDCLNPIPIEDLPEVAEEFSCKYCYKTYAIFCVDGSSVKGLYKKLDKPKKKKIKTGRGIYSFSIDLWDRNISRVSRFSGFAVVFQEEKLGNNFIRVSLGLVTGLPEYLLEEVRERISLIMRPEWVEWEYKEDVQS